MNRFRAIKALGNYKPFGILCAAMLATSLGGCLTKKKPPATEMVTPVMELSAGQTGEKALTTATVSQPQKRVSDSGEANAPAQNDDPNSHLLVFPRGKFTISGEQNKALGEFVKDGRKRRKKFSVIAYAEPQAANTGPEAHMKNVVDAKRRAQATGVFLRLHGVKPEKVTVRTDDTGNARAGDVKIFLN